MSNKILLRVTIVTLLLVDAGISTVVLYRMNSGGSASAGTFSSIVSSVSGTSQRAALIGPGSGLVAWYTFDDITGPTVPDSSGNGNNGTWFNTPGIVAGKSGSALDFNGTNQYVEIPSSASINSLTAGMTVAMWVKKQRNESGFRNLLSRQWGTGNDDLWNLFVAGTDPIDDDYRVSVYTTDNPDSDPDADCDIHSGDSGIPDIDIWTHLVGVFDGSNLKLYRNAVLIGSVPCTGAIRTNTAPITIGASYNGGASPDQNIDAIIDDTRIYDRALSGSEVQELYDLQGGDGNPLVWMKFNENTGTSPVNSGTAGGTFTRSSPTPAWVTNVPSGAGGVSSLDWNTTQGNYFVESAALLPALGGLAKFTITGWVNNRSTAAGAGGNRIVTWIKAGGEGVDLVYRGDGASAGALQIGIDQWPDGSPAISSAGKITTPNANADPTNWRFFAVTYDSTLGSNHVKFYFGSQTADASLDVQRSYSGRGEVGTLIGDLAIGHFNDASRSGNLDRMFRGVIDDVRIYGRVLPLTEIIAVQGGPNIPPTVSITSPADGSSFATGSNITISATASDSDGTITKVEFYQGATLLGTDTTSPYSYTWSVVPAGSYSLTAKATDNAGAVTTSAVVSITVSSNSPPTVSITSPSSGASFTSGSNITISATASDSDGTISKVEFYKDTTAGGNKLGEDTTSPYSFTWVAPPDGSYTLLARATDNGGAKTTSVGVSVTVSPNSPPSVSITSPADGSSFATGSNITISATASDSDGTISKVDFYQGATLLGTDTTSPYSYTWSAVPAGSYSLTAKATDNAGAETTSAVVSITVTTGDTIPPEISNVRATNITLTSATILWDTDEPADSRVKYGLTSPPGTWTSTVDQAPNGVFAHSMNLSGLTSNTTYYYFVRSRDEALNSATSDTFTFPTTPPSSLCNNGSRVVTANNANVRVSPGLGNALLGTQLSGTPGTALGSQSYADNMWWCLVDFDSGVDGWTAESNLAEGIPPVLSNGAPSGEFPVTTTSVTVSLVSDERTICKMNLGAPMEYDAMTDTFLNTDSTSHSETKTVTFSTFYTYYVKCIDPAGNTNVGDFTINFSVTDPPTYSLVFGTRVVTTESINVRTSPGLSRTCFAGSPQPKHAFGVVNDDPYVSDPIYVVDTAGETDPCTGANITANVGHWWWNINYETHGDGSASADGWSVEEYLVPADVPVVDLIET